MQRKRILFWTDWYLPSIGGVEVFSGRLVPALVQRRHEVTVVAGHHQAGLPDEIDLDGVRVHRIPFHQALVAHDVDAMSTCLRRVARLTRAAAPDLVHLNTLGPSVLFHLRTARTWPAPVLLTLHSPVMDDAGRRDTLYGQALRAAGWVNANSRAVQAELCRRVPEMAARCSVTYYGMDPPALPPAPRPLERPLVLAFGRLVPEKGFDLAIRAFAAVRTRCPSARLVIAGDGPARRDLERLVADCGLAGSAEFIGPVSPDDVPSLVNTSSLVVVPSRWDEPFGLVALEAALMARPVVAARTGGLAEVVEDGTTGILVEREDWAAMGEAIVRLLQSPESADAMGAAARRRARELFAWDRCVDEYERLYEQVAPSPRRASHG